jgi:uncharacterized OB-fold protein
MSEWTAAMAALPVVEPVPEPEVAPYWQAAREGRLVVARCPECSQVVWIPRPFCPDHPGAAMSWEGIHGRGTVYSWTRVHRGEGAFASSAPYILAYVELIDGPRVLSNLITAADEEPSIGQSVRAVFDQRPAAGAVLRFVTEAAAQSLV